MECYVRTAGAGIALMPASTQQYAVTSSGVRPPLAEQRRWLNTWLMWRQRGDDASL